MGSPLRQNAIAPMWPAPRARISARRSAAVED